MARGDDYSRTVYSTEWGRTCPNCSKPVEQCACKKGTAKSTGDGIARVRLEKQKRGGKTVTTITGLILDEAGLKALASDFKRKFGSGGAVKDGVIEIQGDHADEIVAEIKARGYKAKRAGG